MKKSFLTLIIVLLTITISALGIRPIYAPSTGVYLDPKNTMNTSLQSETPKTIRPMADGTFTDWTRNTLTIRPDGEGTFNDPQNVTGRILTLNPDGNPSNLGTSAQWSSWVHITPENDVLTWTNWTGSFSSWDDWPTNDGDSSYVYTNRPNYNETSNLFNPAIPPRAFGIVKVMLTMVAKNTLSSDECIRMMLVIGGSMYNGSLITPTTSYLTSRYGWLTNPRTSLAWTWNDIDLLQAGVKSQQTGATWTGELRVTQLYVSILTSGVYTDWDEWPDNNGDTDYIFATANTKVQSSALPDHNPTTDTWTIQRVRVTIFAKQNVTGADAESLSIVLVIGGVAYPSATAVTPTTTYVEYTAEWPKNPVSNLAWAWSDIDALEAGVKSVQIGSKWTGELRVTQVYVKVIEPGAYPLWSETSQDGDATYASAISGSRVRSSTLQNHASESWSISRVQVSIVARTDISTDERVTLLLVVGGIARLGSTFTPTTAYATYSSAWTKNPATNLPWTWAEIDALEAGVKSVQYGTAWKGEIRVTQLYVVVGETGTYTEWDDLAQDGDSSYVSATMDVMKESSQLENPVYPAWSISRVRVVIYARSDVTTDEQVQPTVAISGVEYPGTSYTVTTNYAKYTGDWGKNPATGLRWAWSDIDALEAGVHSVIGSDKIWTGELRVTQLYVEVYRLDFSVDVKVSDVIDLYGFDFRINYSATALTATALYLGSFFPPDSVIIQEDLNDTTGSSRYMVVLPLGTPNGVSGSGTLATIDFTVKSYGMSSLIVCNVELRDTNAVLITPVTLTGGYFDNRLPGDITGPENPPGSGQYPFDKKVDTYDLAYLGKKFGTTDPVADFTGPENPVGSGTYPPDGTVNTYDLAALGKNFGKSIP